MLFNKPKYLKKRGEISIKILATIIITLVGISLLIWLFSARFNVPKKLYCKTIYKSNQLKKDTFCEDYLELELNYLKKKIGQL